MVHKVEVFNRRRRDGRGQGHEERNLVTRNESGGTGPREDIREGWGVMIGSAACRVVRGRRALIVLWGSCTCDLALTDVDSCYNDGKHIVEKTSSARQ